jgi:hypothetical protein
MVSVLTNPVEMIQQGAPHLIHSEDQFPKFFQVNEG